MESGPLRKVRMGCSLKVEDEVGHFDNIDTEKGLRRSKRVGFLLGAIKDRTKQEERKVNKQSKKSIPEFSDLSMSLALSKKWPLYLSTKNTIMKK
ncbi:unnamed protein product [Malus baccata var. baccata]